MRFAARSRPSRRRAGNARSGFGARASAGVRSCCLSFTDGAISTDASTLPTYLGPIARAYYFRTAKLTPAERKERKELFGSFRDGLRPVSAYQWDIGEGRRLLEIPVTTIPWVKTPFHLSYLLYLSRFSPALMRAYLGMALLACRAARVEPSFLLHPLDLIGGDQVPKLAFFPGMDLPSQWKVEVFSSVLRAIASQYTIVPMGTHARAITERPSLRVVEPKPFRGA